MRDIFRPLVMDRIRSILGTIVRPLFRVTVTAFCRDSIKALS